MAATNEQQGSVTLSGDEVSDLYKLLCDLTDLRQRICSGVFVYFRKRLAPRTSPEEATSDAQ